MKLDYNFFLKLNEETLKHIIEKKLQQFTKPLILSRISMGSQTKISFNNENIPFFGKTTFFFLGLSSLIGWNAILIGLDYFTRKFPDYDYSFYVSIPMFIATNFINIIIHYLSRFMGMKSRIIVGLIGQIIMLIIIPIQAQFQQNSSGFYVALLLIFIEGCAISITQSSSIAFASLCPFECVSIYFTGTGIGGVLIALFRAIMLGTIGADSDDAAFLGTLIYFIVASLLILSTIVMFLIFYKTDFCQNHLNNSHSDSVLNDPLNNELDFVILTDIHSDCSQEEEKKPKKDAINRKKNIHFIFNVFKKIHPLPILIVLIYIQTFMLFPGVALIKKAMSDPAWNADLLVLVYNIGDSVGKYLAKFRNGYNVVSTTVLILGRFLFFLSFLVMTSKNNAYIISAVWFAFFNMFFFAASNGYATCTVMVLAPERVNKNEKETAGFIMNNGLYLGMMVGSFLALVFQNIGN